MSLKFHEIAEGSHRILNPFNIEKLLFLAELCDVEKGQTLLDIACGKGEMLNQWASLFEITGVGVDLSKVFIDAAKERAEELNTTKSVNFIQSEGAEYLKKCTDKYDLVSCIGATWIGDGLTGTLELMKPCLKDSSSTLLVGEPYWVQPCPDEIKSEYGEKDTFASLEGTLDRFEESGFELIEMLMADNDDWDRYEASQWKTVYNWLEQNPKDKDAPALKKWISENRRMYMNYGRFYFNWGVFVLKQK